MNPSCSDSTRLRTVVTPVSMRSTWVVKHRPLPHDDPSDQGVDPLPGLDRPQGVVLDRRGDVEGDLGRRVEAGVGDVVQDRVVPLVPDPREDGYGRQAKEPSPDCRSLSQARSVTEPPPRMTTRASKGCWRWAGRAFRTAVRIEDGASSPWKVARKRRELAEPRPLEPVGFPLEVAQPRRGLGADDGDPDEIDRCRKSLVPVV